MFAFFVRLLIFSSFALGIPRHTARNWFLAVSCTKVALLCLSPVLLTCLCRVIKRNRRKRERILMLGRRADSWLVCCVSCLYHSHLPFCNMWGLLSATRQPPLPTAGETLGCVFYGVAFVSCLLSCCWLCKRTF